MRWLDGKILLRKERLPTPVFWPEEFHELYSPWGCKGSDTTERLSLHFTAANNWKTKYKIIPFT